MAHILISFLGKSVKQNGQYRQANYCFADGSQKTARFFSLALNGHIQPDRLVMLGTSGSMWDVLCEHLSTDGNDQWAALSEAVEADAVTQAQLDAFSCPVGLALHVDCQLKRIPYGDDITEQVEILQIMAAAIQAGDTVSLDLTHGLRHLPMLGLLSAMYLQTARSATINGIYYGALDRTKNNLTPVMQLNGLLNIAQWLHALDGFNKTGNLAPFSGLLQQDGMAPEIANCLEEAAFFENTLNIPNARTPLKKFTAATKDGLPSIGALFESSLKERIAWHKEDNLYLRQRSNACFYLQQGDYLRAAALGYEAFITRCVQQDKSVPKLDPQNYEHRQQTKDTLKKNDGYKLLNDLRNALAHGTRSDKAQVQRALSNKDNLHTELEQLFERLLPKH
ncbi:TIGR02221 family CRISPR-associated protein [Methylovulum psychrotolerans]|uniref:CRISPR-associated protein n=1 Tax=Methylovulum psychrotolerans TaxID=1704499 RepID=A0A1Z4BYQ8_9GAMM|nr:TIGR02221 family CRISPR-associated protein [Methylovulum psychrotolerans]ASF46390.1 CRISPR-associated protein [Methylovulum psychrotolerans]